MRIMSRQARCVYVFVGLSLSMLLGCPPCVKTMPDITGLVQLEAIAALHNAGITSYELFYVDDQSVASGEVVHQCPAAGSTLTEDSLITMNISLQDTFTKTFGGVAAEYGCALQAVSGGGYIVLGNTSSFGAGEHDVYLLKTDANGAEVWAKTFGGSGYDVAYNVQKTSDGGYIIAGHTTSFGAGEHDVYLLKTDANGNELWSKTIGGAGLDLCLSIQETADGGYFAAGYTNSFGAGELDLYLIKIDANGVEVWAKAYGGAADDYCKSAQVTADGGCILAGYTSSFGAGGEDIYLIKTDANGEQEWAKTYGGSGYDRGKSVQVTSDGGYILTGSFGADSAELYLVKTDAEGEVLWSSLFGGEEHEQGKSVCETPDGGFIVTGLTYSFGAGDSDIYVIKTDAFGNGQSLPNPAP